MNNKIRRSNRKCIFCQLLNESKSYQKIADLKVSKAFINLDQTYFGRTLVIYKDHTEDILELQRSEINQFTQDMIKIAEAIKKAFTPDTINYAILGGTVNHLHWHIIPRYITEKNWSKPPYSKKRKFIPKSEYIKIVKSIRNHLR